MQRVFSVGVLFGSRGLIDICKLAMGKKRLQNRKLRWKGQRRKVFSFHLESGFVLPPPHPFLISFITSIQRVWMIQIGPGFLAVIWFGPSPLSNQQVFHLYQTSCVSPVELSDGRGWAVGGEAKSYDGEKTWSSIHHLILSASICTLLPLPPSDSRGWNDKNKYWRASISDLNCRWRLYLSTGGKLG
jgi:hypothetical protein